MDKYEFNIKVEQIKKLVSKGDYETAMKIADTIDWRRVRSTNLLAMVADIYENNKEYQEAKEILLLAFERAPIGKRLLYKLSELALKEGSIKEAEDYYREFCDLAPEDPRQHLLRYLILKGKKAPEEQLIHSLERYTNIELDEKWLYELAELYCKAGQEDACIRTCDKIMLMFGLGKYVEKAMDLKVQYAPLSSYQIDLIENRDKYEEKLRAVEQQFGGAPRRMLDDDYDDTDQGTDEMDAMTSQSDLSRLNLRMEDEPVPYRAMDQDLAASFHQAETEERLAEAVSQISIEEYNEPESPMDQTKIIRNIRDVLPVYSQEEPDMEAPLSDTRSMMPASTIVVDEVAAMESALAEEPEEEPVEESNQMGNPEPETDEQVCRRIAAVKNHLMIEARNPERGLETAVNALKQFHRESGTKTPVIKISGSKLSNRGVFASSDKLAGRDLVIEEAGDLTPEALIELNELMMKDRTGMTVVLIDNPRQIETMCQVNPGLASMFTFLDVDALADSEVRSEIPAPDSITEQEAAPADVMPEGVPAPGTVREPSEPVYNPAPIRTSAQELEPEKAPAVIPAPVKTVRKSVIHENAAAAVHEAAATEEPQDIPVRPEQACPVPARTMSRTGDEDEMELRAFVDYACQYASDIDCSISGKSMLALYERIEVMEENGVPLTKVNAEDLIEEAADKAEKFSVKRIFTGLFAPKYDKEGLLVLREEHFMN